MKISKQKLIQIITEEVQLVLQEGGYGNRSKRDIMIGNISDMFKEMHGVRPRQMDFGKMSDEELAKLESEISGQYNDWHNEERVQDDLEDLYIQSEKELMSYMDLQKAEKEAEKQKNLMMTPEEGEEIPTQIGMSKKMTNRNLRYRMEQIIKDEYADIIEEMFGMSKSNKSDYAKGEVLYHTREPDSMQFALSVRGTDRHLVKVTALGGGYAPKIKQGQNFSMPSSLVDKAYMKKSSEIDPDTGKKINIINLSEEMEEGGDKKTPRDLLAMLITAEEIARLRADYPDDLEMQKELDRIEAHPSYNPSGAYKTPRKKIDLHGFDSEEETAKFVKDNPSYFNENISEGLQHHIDTTTPLTDNIYRIGSDEYFNIIREARVEYKKGTYKPLNEEEQEMLESDLGEWAEFEGENVPLDFPMYEETLEEKKKKKKKKKDPPIGKPMKNTGGGKKYKVFVRTPSGRIKKISYGDSKGGLKGNWNSAEARKSFASRHNCAEKKDRTKAGYWTCRSHKDFGTNVPGRFW